MRAQQTAMAQRIVMAPQNERAQQTLRVKKMLYWVLMNMIVTMMLSGLALNGALYKRMTENAVMNCWYKYKPNGCLMMALKNGSD